MDNRVNKDQLGTLLFLYQDDNGNFISKQVLPGQYKFRNIVKALTGSESWWEPSQKVFDRNGNTPVVSPTKSPRRNGNVSPRLNGNKSPRRNGSPPRLNGNRSPRRNGNVSPVSTPTRTRNNGTRIPQTPRKVNGTTITSNRSPTRLNGNRSPREEEDLGTMTVGELFEEVVESPRRNDNVSPRLNGNRSPRRNGNVSPASTLGVRRLFDEETNNNGNSTLGIRNLFDNGEVVNNGSATLTLNVDQNGDLQWDVVNDEEIVDEVL